MEKQPQQRHKENPTRNTTGAGSGNNIKYGQPNAHLVRNHNKSTHTTLAKCRYATGSHDKHNQIHQRNIEGTLKNPLETQMHNTGKGEQNKYSNYT